MYDEPLHAPKGSRHILSDIEISDLFGDVSTYMFSLLSERFLIALSEADEDAWLDALDKWAEAVFDIQKEPL
jgi:hypothetical protein